jgi:hypothetical protein
MKKNMNISINTFSKVFYQTIKQTLVLFFISVLLLPQTNAQILPPPVPAEWRGAIDAERSGQHDANLIRTIFYNYGMVGDYFGPEKDRTVNHSVEIPKGSGENYSDGTTPFVLARIVQTDGTPSYIMETGYRERQAQSPVTNKIMRFEPRFGYFQTDPIINQGRSVALSNDPRTWPNVWHDKLDDPDDAGWSGSWNGFFGKIPKADQESYVVYDDNFYDAWNYFPDYRDVTRRGLGMRVEQRGFQWANPQAGLVIFFHYDITNESTTKYDNNIIFGLYMDSGVGGSGIGKDGVYESDDDNAYFDKSAVNLVYTWDKNGNGVVGKTGYLGYSYLETPGNSSDGIDNDKDGITNEKRNSGPGQPIIGQDAIRNYVTLNYDLSKFESFYGPIENLPAYIAGVWFTGDEDMDWIAEFDDTGIDGVFGTGDTGENDGIPSSNELLGSEPNFDKVDIDESDQIGLTGFKFNRIRAGASNPNAPVDGILFYDDPNAWPSRLYNLFSDPATAFEEDDLVLDFNIGFLFASGPFLLGSGSRERFSLALGYGANLTELKVTTKIVQQIYKANYQFAIPPPLPTANVFSGDGFVTINWDNAAESAYDPITNNNDFEGYRVYRSTDPSFLDPLVIYTGTGTRPFGKKPIAQFDLKNNIAGYSTTTVDGIAYYLGEDTGIRHSFKDSTVVNGQRYFYAVVAYDRGVDSVQIYPSENAVAISQTLRGGIIFPQNTVEATPNPPSLGYKNAETLNFVHSEGRGTGNVSLSIVNSELVPENHSISIRFDNSLDSVRAQSYYMIDESEPDSNKARLFELGLDLLGEGSGPVGAGIFPTISTPKVVEIDTANTKFVRTSGTNIPVEFRYSPSFPIGLKRIGYPENIDIVFSNVIVDTSVAGNGLQSKFVKFNIYAITDTGRQKLKFRFKDFNNSGSGTIDSKDDFIEILTAQAVTPTQRKATWNIKVTESLGIDGNTILPPTLGDKFEVRLFIPFSKEDKFTFITKGQFIDPSLAKNQFENNPYVVPNPYVGAASFEPQRFGVSGRGERKIEFRSLAANSTIRIYTITGELVQTLKHDGNINEGVVAWDLRNSDNLEVAPGLYIFHVDGPDVGTFIGKFAIIK